MTIISKIGVRMIVEGINCVTELLKSSYKMEKVILDNSTNPKIDEIIALCTKRAVKFEIVDKKTLTKIGHSEHHQGVIAFVPSYEYCFVEDILKSCEEKGKAPFLVMLDGIEDPHNVGAIIRTAECMGVDGVIIGKNRACEINETVFKTSAGAIAFMKVAQVTNLSQTITKLKEKNIWCYALEAGNTTLDKTNLTGGVLLVVGSEGFGVSNLVSKTCDGTISIPMYGEINSLNASNAIAIAMYEVARQNKNTK